MRILYCGSAQFGISCLEAINNSEHDLTAVYTQPARHAGRGRKTRPTDVARWCSQNQINAIETPNINKPETIKDIKNLNADLMVVIAFGQKISDELIYLFPKGAINVHASLLPKYRGAAPINWAIINGEKKTGLSIITLASKMDAGDILGMTEVDIAETDTTKEVHDKLCDAAPSLLMKTINKIEDGTVKHIKQDDSQATLAPKLKKADGRIDFRESAEQIKNKIHGLWPWPGAQSYYVTRHAGRSDRTTIARARIADRPEGNWDQPGVLDDNLNVVCGEGSLEIIQIKPAGSHLMNFSDFVNGRKSGPGDLFVPIDEIKS